MTISIVTCDHERSYLQEILNFVPKCLDVEIFFQGAAPKTFCNERVKRTVYTPRKYGGDKFPHRDAQLHYANALIQSTDKLIIEDDIRLARNFDVHFRQCVKDAKEAAGVAPFILALYSAYNWGMRQLKVVNYPGRLFYGLLCMFYHREAALGLGNFILNRIGVEPHDLAVNSYVNQNPETRLFASSLSLGQHIGLISTGLGAGLRQTGNFIDDVIPADA